MAIIYINTKEDKERAIKVIEILAKNNIPADLLFTFEDVNSNFIIDNVIEEYEKENDISVSLYDRLKLKNNLLLEFRNDEFNDNGYKESLFNVGRMVINEYYEEKENC